MAMFPTFRTNCRRLKRLTTLFYHSPIFRPSVLLFVLLLALLGGQAWLNYQNNYNYGKIMTAVKDRQATQYYKLVAQFILLFFALTLVAVFYRFVEDHLALLLRRGLTQHLIDTYLGDRAFLRLLSHPEVDNPDQRITEDVKTLAINIVSFVLIVINSAVNFYLFSNILSDISTNLVWAAAVYAAVGSFLTLLIGKRLVSLNIDQLHKEADLRYELVRTREHAEAITLQHDEGRQGPRLISRLWILVENMRRIIARNAFLGLFTKPFDYLVLVVPILIVAPLVIRQEKEIGAVTQSVDAFRFVVNAFSVLVTEFPRLTLLTAVVARLGELVTAIRTPVTTNGIRVEVNGDLLEVRDLELLDPSDGHKFFGGQRINFRVEPGQHTLIIGGPGTGKSELLRAMAELWSTGSGTIVRPPLDRITFVSPQPYLTPSTLRQLMTPHGATVASSNEELIEFLRALNLDELINRVGGLDKERDWDATLALAERQAIALARLLVLRPRFAVINEVTGILDGDTRRAYYQRLDEAGVTVVTLSSRRILPEFHKRQLLLPSAVGAKPGHSAA